LHRIAERRTAMDAAQSKTKERIRRRVAELDSLTSELRERLYSGALDLRDLVEDLSNEVGGVEGRLQRRAGRAADSLARALEDVATALRSLNRVRRRR
jgi:hypothetical protein